MPLSDIYPPFDKSQVKWSTPQTIQFVAVACVLCWLLFLVGVEFL